MKCLYIQVFVIYSIASLFLHAVKSEFYTAIVEMEKLLHTEREIVRTLKTYLQVEEERLERVKRLSKQYEILHKLANNDVEKFLSNPVNAYLLVKRLTADWETANQLIESPDSRAVISGMETQVLNFPTNEDLQGAAKALIRLQKIYLLDTAAIASGQIKGAVPSTELTAGDCFELGRQAYNDENYNHDVLWMHESMSRAEKEDIKTANKIDILEYMAYTSYLLGNFTAAIQLTEQLIALEPDHPRALENLVYYRTYAGDTEAMESTKINDGQEDVPVDNSVDTLHPNVVETYGRLCRGESLKTAEEQSKLHCYYTTNKNSYLLLQPVKVEVLNLKPRIVMYYDVLKDWEMDVIKSLALPKLTRATVSNKSSGQSEVSNYRISKSAWLVDYEHRLLPRIKQRVEDITGLDTNNAEELHVINYGIGGHYAPHYDFSMVGDKVYFLKTIGNRIATWIFYISDVQAGGSTVFTSARVEVKPIKGAAVFWYNLHRNGIGDQETRHAACPVLAGSKWVSTLWLHEKGNEFTRPCSLDPLE